MKLFLTEKPSQARDIARVVNATEKKNGYIEGDSIVVTWAFGHLLAEAEPDDYNPDYKRWSLGDLPIIPDPWQYKVDKGAKKQLNIIKRLLKQAQSVVIATDADREGETIGRSILEYCHWRGEIKRLWLSALDDKSIRKALSSLKQDHETLPLYYAGQARTRADWLIGMNLSRLYTLLAQRQGFDKPVSVGRVQTPTLKMVVDRDKSIAAFTPLPYYTISITLEKERQQFTAQWIPKKEHLDVDEQGRCIVPAYASSTEAALQATRTVTLTDAAHEEKSQPPPLVFALSDLQVLMNKRNGMRAADVLKIAQELYEAKLISYPRTGCGYLPTTQRDDAQAILKQLGKIQGLAQLIQHADLSLVSRCWNDAKVAKSSHHGMIPTGDTVALNRQSKDALQVYAVIATRYIAQFYPAYQYQETTLLFTHDSNEHFRATGKTTLHPGWKVVLGNMDDAKERRLPHIEHVPIELPIQSIDQVTKQTTPPARFTEGSLLSAMKHAAKFVENPQLKAMLRETTGIGTEATRADIIKNLLNKQFLTSKGREILSTREGQAVIATVTPQISEPAITALWEQALEDIAHGKQTRDAFLQKQGEWIKQLVKDALGRNDAASAFHRVSPPSTLCPQCGNPLKRRKGKHGFFWSCSDYPTCQYAASDIKGQIGRNKHSAQ